MRVGPRMLRLPTGSNDNPHFRPKTWIDVNSITSVEVYPTINTVTIRLPGLEYSTAADQIAIDGRWKSIDDFVAALLEHIAGAASPGLDVAGEGVGRRS